MQSWAERQTMSELNNPSSPYYLGSPTAPQQVRNFLNGGGYTTNYFGSSARGVLAQPNVDLFHRRNVVTERKKFNEILSLVGTGVLATLGFLAFRKIPGSKTLLSLTGSVLKLPFTALKYTGKALLWLCKGSKV